RSRSMQVIHDAWNSTDLPRDGVVTIGNYDGLHRGQQAIVDRVVERARGTESPAVVVSFDPHPLEVLDRREAPERLVTDEQKEALLARSGVDALLVIRFDEEFASRSAEEFVRGFLVERLQVREVLVGASFRFGHGREGDVDLLQEMSEELGFRVEGLEEETYRGVPISSTRIRGAVEEGRVEEAMEMLDRPYELVGLVVRGDRMGKRLGWPTVNIEPENELVPAEGVYATRIRFSGLEATFDGVTNIGTRPTVYENYERVVETHVLDFGSDVYDQAVELGFFKRLREEKLFPTIMDLSAQIRRDVDATREFFSHRRKLEELEAESV
ncbi:MAG: bifunctional riboflavin kinase/FAD synthetase, partial [Thermoanaerobaculia bacterium]|nr:bifunctional riboflavin kinase/FAD synthetase [Thermoanaerobaculia bacterium]